MPPNENSPTNEVEPKGSALPQNKGEDKLHATLSLAMDSRHSCQDDLERGDTATSLGRQDLHFRARGFLKECKFTFLLVGPFLKARLRLILIKLP